MCIYIYIYIYDLHGSRYVPPSSHMGSLAAPPPREEARHPDPQQFKLNTYGIMVGSDLNRKAIMRCLG